MTHIFQTRSAHRDAWLCQELPASSRNRRYNRTFQVEVIDFDGDLYTLFVDAYTVEEASRKAASICAADMIEINYIANIFE